jgi:hypothetical protein
MKRTVEKNKNNKILYLLENQNKPVPFINIKWKG